MLLEFKVSNCRSIGDEQVISLIPALKQKDHAQNIIRHNRYNALNAIALYGANASGKSNILKAMSLLDKIIHISARTASTTKLPYDPFLLREDWINKPTTFEIMFVVGENRYRYGFAFNADEIQKEWLFRKRTGREVNLFVREGDTIDVASGYNGTNKLIDAAIEATRTNALFLSTCDILNIEEAKAIMKWFRNFNMVDGLNADKSFGTVELWDNYELREKIKEYMSSLCLGIVDIDVEKKVEEVNSNVQKQSIKVSSKHQLYSSSTISTDNLLSWNFLEKESAGTKQAFHLSGNILWALANGGVLIIDEIEAKLHPIMTLNTIELFLNKQSNPNNAQLIFATHDTNLLSYAKLRRDQIYFAEKNKWESTEVFSLADFVYFGEKYGEFVSEKERPDTDKEKRYIEGRYGAVPVLGDFQNFIRKIQWQKEEK
ncbi:MAG: ATP-binding protein [Tannerella sp.]|jgi:AAA15 family ATPase/GTPase|nr:ATP-binding protein [Tannerella sp.]